MTKQGRRGRQDFGLADERHEIHAKDAVRDMNRSVDTVNSFLDGEQCSTAFPQLREALKSLYEAETHAYSIADEKTTKRVLVDAKNSKSRLKDAYKRFTSLCVKPDKDDHDTF